MPRRTAEADVEPALRTTDLLVLAVLSDGPQHGYGLAREIGERTRGHIRIRPGDLYRVLYRMDRAGLIEASANVPRRDGGDERRAYYRITVLGRRVARAQATLLSEICASVLSRRQAASGATS